MSRRLLPVLIAGLILAGCGGKSTTTTTGPSARALAAAAARTEITNVWLTFFNGAQPSGRATLLQNAGSFSAPLATIAHSVLARQLSATVSSVVVHGPNRATVTYDLLLNNKPIVSNAIGTAVRVNGHWLVGVGSFCKLLTLEGAMPASCSNASP